MLKTIIKRNGSREDFQPSKLNKWSQWASEGLRDRVDWSGIVLETVKAFGEVAHSQELQAQLILNCITRKEWSYGLMAGRLFAATYRKELYDEYIPTIKALHNKLFKAGLMIKLNYSDEEYSQIESIIDHERDFSLAYSQIKYIRGRYALKNSVTKKEYETPQFVFMRMAMQLAEAEPADTRITHVKEFYNHFSFNRINPPSPNYTNLGTSLRGYASCCLYTSADDLESIGIGDYIAYTMTAMSAGIGGNLNVRSVGDPVRNGAITHQGKMPYYNHIAGAVMANMQAGRGGACTQYYSAFDPENEVIMMAQNPRTPVDKQNRNLHFAMMGNRLLGKKVAKSENIFLFNVFTAPDLTKLFFSGDQDGFEELYNKYEADVNFKKTYIPARDFVAKAVTQSFEVGTHYLAFIDEINRHTPYKEPIHSSNLCVEITQPTSPYYDMRDLLTAEDHGRGEVSLCSLGGIVECNIKSDEEYASAAYYTLKMIDYCIHNSDYPLAHVGFTAKQRLNAGIGILGVAVTMAREGLKYDTPEGLKRLHEMAERHAYFCISASLKLGKELGNAPWMHKTKWAEGWLPIDTYKRTVDQITPAEYKYSWETLRSEIIANKGIRNSSVIAHMPTESSSKASGVPNSLYPIRDLYLKKTDESNITEWCAVDSDILGENYQSAWTIKSLDMIKVYAVWQKFTDQAISADLWKDRSIEINLSKKEMVDEYLAMIKYGMKTRYYQNSLTGSQSKAAITVNSTEAAPAPETILEAPVRVRGCSGGVCDI